MEVAPNILNHAQELIFARTAPRYINMKIYTKQNKQDPLYYVDISGSFNDHTSLTLHTGGSKDDPTLGVADFNKFRTAQIQMKQRDHPNFKMMMSHGHGYYWSIPSANVSGGQEKGDADGVHHFLWKELEPHSPASPGSGKLELGLYNSLSSELHAVYMGAAPGTRKGGVLRFEQDLGDEWRIKVILTLSALVEKARQKRAREGSFTVGMLAF